MAHGKQVAQASRLPDRWVCRALQLAHGNQNLSRLFLFFVVCLSVFLFFFPILRRVQGVSAHGELIIFAVCLKSWHTANSSRRRQVPVTPSSCFFAPCNSTNTRQRCLPCARNLAHGKLGLCRSCSCRRRFAVGTLGEYFAVCLGGFAVCPRHTAKYRNPVVVVVSSVRTSSPWLSLGVGFI